MRLLFRQFIEKYKQTKVQPKRALKGSAKAKAKELFDKMIKKYTYEEICAKATDDLLDEFCHFTKTNYLNPTLAQRPFSPSDEKVLPTTDKNDYFRR